MLGLNRITGELMAVKQIPKIGNKLEQYVKKKKNKIEKKIKLKNFVCLNNPFFEKKEIRSLGIRNRDPKELPTQKHSPLHWD